MTSTGTTRTRTYDYVPTAIDPSLLHLRGIDAMRAILRGDIAPPPMAATLGFALVEVDEGRAVFEGTAGDWATNPMGSVHGGFAATLLDSALGCAVHSALPVGRVYTTVDLRVTMVRAIGVATGPLRAAAQTVHVGSRIATAEAKLTGVHDGKLYAHGSATCAILELADVRYEAVRRAQPA